MAKGFSLVEVVVALVMFTIGVLGLGATIGYVSGQVEAADLRTERSTAVRRVVERLHALPFDSVDDRTEADAQVINGYEVWWTVDPAGTHRKAVELYTEGPGYSVGTRRQAAVRDTVETTIANKRLDS